MYSSTLKPHLFIIFPLFASSIRVSDIRVPSYHLSGEDLRLNCSYKHDSGKEDPLYSVKWYRGADHFYEFTPNKKGETKKAFPFKGLKVDLNRSVGSSVYLSDVDRSTSGTFRCEVMSDKPHFETDSVYSNLTVVDAPVQDLKIYGVENNSQVRVGDHIKVYCSLGDTDPPANLTWIVNGRTSVKVTDSNKVRKSDSWGPLIEASFDHYLNGKSFVKGALHIECLAEIYDAYRRSQQVVLLDVDRPKAARIGWWFSSGCSQTETSSGIVLLFVVASKFWATY